MSEAGSSAVVVCVQPTAIVDHVCKVDDAVLGSLVEGDLGGSSQCVMKDVGRMLSNVPEFISKPGGSIANMTRGLASGFGIKCNLIGVRGNDEWGVMFKSSMKRAHVNLDGLVTKDGNTARCVILAHDGQRTMRTCFENAVRLDAGSVEEASFAGCKWAFVSCYALYTEGLLDKVLELAEKAGARVALDLAAFEMVRRNRKQIIDVIQSGRISICFCNEDEARELDLGTPEECLEAVGKHCEYAVVTLGEKGCVAKRQGEQIVRELACSGLTVTDSTGAGDLFDAGFLYGIINGYDTRKCAQLGNLAGGAVIQTLGAEVSPEGYRWLHARLHGELAAEVVRDSPAAVHKELLGCYTLIQKLGRGVVYYGSARLKKDSAHWQRAVDLGRDVSRLLGSTTWSGGGPGMMEAASVGAKEAGNVVGGIRISREAGTTVLTASYLPPENQAICKYMSPRKVALVDAGVRMSEEERTAYIYLPGGLGTMDELFELMTLIQLNKIGTKFRVPVVLCNYDGFYDGLLTFLVACEANKTVGAKEMSEILIADTNEQVLDTLADFYSIDRDPGRPKKIARAASSYIELAGQPGA
eukprot:jgi/Tetstr1/424743/TSEL_015260.t1